MITIQLQMAISSLSFKYILDYLAYLFELGYAIHMGRKLSSK